MGGTGSGFTAGGWEAAGGQISGGGEKSGGGSWGAAGGDGWVVGNPSGNRGTSTRERKVVLGKSHSEAGTPEGMGEAIEGGVLACGGRGTGAIPSEGGSVCEEETSGRSGPVRSGVGSGPSCEAGGSITSSGLGGRGGAGGVGTGGRSESKASSSIPMTNWASRRREARTETFFRVRRRSTSRVEFRCDAEEIVHRTS